MASIFRIVLTLFFLSGCSSLLYYPDNYLHVHPDQVNVKFKDFTFNSLDGTKLSGWKLYSEQKPRNLIAFFHGNAENLTSHFVNLFWLTKADSEVLIFDYRGYGVSEGKPSPKGVYEDGVSFLNYAYEEYKKGGYKNFIIYTQSLGGTVALRSLEDFTHRDEIKLLVLDSTFLSVREVARDKTFWPLSLLITDSYTANRTLSHITMPVISIHAKYDPVINYNLGVDLYNHLHFARSKEFWTIEGKGHGDVFYDKSRDYRQEFSNILKSL